MYTAKKGEGSRELGGGKVVETGGWRPVVVIPFDGIANGFPHLSF